MRLILFEAFGFSYPLVIYLPESVDTVDRDRIAIRLYYRAQVYHPGFTTVDDLQSPLIVRVLIMVDKKASEILSSAFLFIRQHTGYSSSAKLLRS